MAARFFMVRSSQLPKHDNWSCIEVGDNCYFGTGCAILGPFKIGNYGTVCAGALVTKDVSDNCTVAGVPAKIIKNI